MLDLPNSKARRVKMEKQRAALRSLTENLCVADDMEICAPADVSKLVFCAC